jgi:hypothetical protein
MFAANRRWGQIAPTLAVLAVVAATAGALFPPMYFVGKRCDDERSFLRNYRAPNEYEAFTSYSMSYANDSHEENDVVFIGDSGVRCNVRTTQFEQMTGLKAYNLGSVGLIGISGVTQITDAYLRHHPKPRLLVLGLVPAALNPSGAEAFGPEERDVKARFLWCFGTGTEDMRPHNSFLYHVRQGFKHTYGVLSGGFARFATEPIPFRGGETYRTLEQTVMRERGFWPAPDVLTRSKPARQKVSTLDPFRVSDAGKKELSALIKLITGHGLTLLIRLSPYAGEAAELSPTLRSWALDLESKEPKVIVARPEVLLYDRELFVDENHLRARGIEKFTTLVSGEVKRVLAGMDLRPVAKRLTP